MPVDDLTKVDAISIRRETGDVILTIFDHLDWNDEDHLLTLQDKINVYLAFVEGGELLQKYPKAEGRQVVIDVVHMNPLTERGQWFIDQARPIVEGAGFSLRTRHQRMDLPATPEAA